MKIPTGLDPNPPPPPPKEFLGLPLVRYVLGDPRLVIDNFYCTVVYKYITKYAGIHALNESIDEMNE